ncbi:MAG: hypothetical protein IPF62_14435 [Bacteroidetes bacterium]|nr:hypothetical protein [Bacteroidota bacterium]
MAVPRQLALVVPIHYLIRLRPGVIDVNTGAATALCAGTYTVTVTDGNLCTATTSFTINEPTAVVTTVTSSTNPTCTPGCDGSVTVKWFWWYRSYRI